MPRACPPHLMAAAGHQRSGLPLFPCSPSPHSHSLSPLAMSLTRAVHKLHRSGLQLSVLVSAPSIYFLAHFHLSFIYSPLQTILLSCILLSYIIVSYFYHTITFSISRPFQTGCFCLCTFAVNLHSPSHFPLLCFYGLL